MADPVTITFAVVTAIGTIVTIIKNINDMRAASLSKAQVGHLTLSSPPILEVGNEASELSQRFNRLVSSLGGRFGENLDSMYTSNCLRIAGDVGIIWLMGSRWD